MSCLGLLSIAKTEFVTAGGVENPPVQMLELVGRHPC